MVSKPGSHLQGQNGLELKSVQSPAILGSANCYPNLRNRIDRDSPVSRRKAVRFSELQSTLSSPCLTSDTTFSMIPEPFSASFLRSPARVSLVILSSPQWIRVYRIPMIGDPPHLNPIMDACLILPDDALPKMHSVGFMFLGHLPHYAVLSYSFYKTVADPFDLPITDHKLT